MWRSYDEEVRSGKHRVKILNLGIIPDKWIGAQHLLRLEPKEMLELVAQAVTPVVALTLEGHAQDARRHVRDVVSSLELGDEVKRQALVDHHAGVAERELVVVERGELHRVLQEARSRRKTCGR